MTSAAISSFVMVFVLAFVCTATSARSIGQQQQQNGIQESERSGRAIKSLCVDYYSQLPYALWKHACGSQTTLNRRGFQNNAEGPVKKSSMEYQQQQSNRMINALYARLFEKLSKDMSENKRSADLFEAEAPMYII
uniref:Hypothetical Ciona neural peptide n=1 Tax=Ciona intestinalis TaxID=7719 RepID=F5XVF2_CIOIN|nr:TPA: hypothetical Ciona neural peptide [Ciona intestinalis]